MSTETAVSGPGARQAARYVGTLDGDLSLAAEEIRHAIIHNAGGEFLVWADADGLVFVAPDYSRQAKAVAEKHPGWVINNYRSRWEIQGVRVLLKAEAIEEDLAFHRDERARA